MKAEKVKSELSRLINSISRTYRGKQDAPKAQEITALAKLVQSYSEILLTEVEPGGKGRDPLRGQAGGYERLRRMHEEMAARQRDPDPDEENDGDMPEDD
jgi:hypothetical protein